MDTRRKSVWETLGLDIGTGEFGSLPITGNKKTVIVEEGDGITGTVAKDVSKATTQTKFDGFEDSSGDSSVVYKQRHDSAQSSHGVSGTKVFVSEDQGSGSNVITTGVSDGRGPNTVTTISRYNTTLINGHPVGTRYENTTIVRGADGRIIDSKVVSGSGRGSSFRTGQYGNTYQQNHVGADENRYATTSSGGRIVGQSASSGSVQSGGGYHGSTGVQQISGSGFNVHSSPNIIYSSSGQQTSESKVSSAAESQYGNAGASGQDFSVTAINSTEDGAPVIAKAYPGHVHAPTSNHFAWKPKPSTDQQFSWDQKEYGLSEETHIQGSASAAGRGQHARNRQEQGGSRATENQGAYGATHSQGSYGATQNQGGYRATQNQGGYKNQYDRQYHQGGEDVYVGNVQRQSHEQAAAQSQSGHNYSWNAAAAAGHGETQSARDKSSYGQHGTSNVQANYDQYGIGGSALNQGFRTSTLDLGKLGHVDIDEGVSSESYEQRNRQSNRVYDPDLGVFVDREPRYVLVIHDRCT